MNGMIQNPILRGFNPDPSIVRVGDDYYIATSTFEWFPGVQIHHSRDLKHWQLLGQVLDRPSQLDMRGAPDSCGVWAPCLSYCDGLFYLVYSNVGSFDGVWKDTPNYLVTAPSIHGPWSEPIFLMSRGFDASLFHDSNGKKWLTNMMLDHRAGKFFGGIQLQEYCPQQQKLVGKVFHIFAGSELGLTEGPHIYQRNGWYYLITAEGGTEYGHAVTMARSREITGPYELHPHNPIMSARDYPDAPLQKTGHADLVCTQHAQWYAVYLAGRPLTPRGRCTLGRETVIEQMEWRDDDWLYPVTNQKTTRLQVPAANLKDAPFKPTAELDSFSEKVLESYWQSLRVPVSENWLSLSEREGFVRLKGRESLSSTRDQSLIARRVQAFDIEASCKIDFSPTNFQQLAGLVCYYNTGHYLYLYISYNELTFKRELHLVNCDNFVTTEPLRAPIILPDQGEILLKVEWHQSEVQFYYAETDPTSNWAPEGWKKIGPVLDGSILSDDHVREMSERYRPAFTGAFVGICCQDLSGMKLHADFDWFHYREFSPSSDEQSLEQKNKQQNKYHQVSE
ncbi:glycoside hydrolase family 43 protein [Cellvibrio sp. NN19]|uniref:glycoside hydrolase family 43 protein n=1 Tax=Cellvibrio chitinivorans TaxID=3102792 RepID=UPI002B4013D1|nr:glycoside hydrolase family 43 protein [Cellvibrio sp. NN19]